MDDAARWALWLSVMLGCVPTGGPAGTDPWSTGECTEAKCDYFENALRRPATAEEHKGMAKVDGCAGFFLANSANAAFVATARHCVGYDPWSWCDSGGFVTDSSSAARLRCVRVLVGHAEHDPFILEVEGRQPEGAMRLAAFVPAVGTPLKMLGYPSDVRPRPDPWDRSSDAGPEAAQGPPLTVTESCWVTSGLASTPFPDSYKNDEVFQHNCAVYGGNSGGPMLLEGTNIAVAQPYTYVRGDSVVRSADDTGKTWGAAMARFVADTRSELDAAGIDVAAAGPEEVTRGDYFVAGSYGATSFPCTLNVVPVYHSGARIRGLRIRSECDSDADYTWCGQTVSATDRYFPYAGGRIRELATTSFLYTAADGAEHRFELRSLRLP